MNKPSNIWKGKVTIEANGCWIFRGHIDAHGYGYISAKDGRWKRAHRVMYEETSGLICKDMMVCHKCNVPSCVNPEHLYQGTNTDNMRDRTNSGYSHSEETKAKMKLVSQKGRASPQKGRKYSYEIRMRMSAAQRLRRLREFTR